MISIFVSWCRGLFLSRKIVQLSDNDFQGLLDDLEYYVHEEDARSTDLAQVDLSKVIITKVLRRKEITTGEERLQRLKEVGHIRLDIRVFRLLQKEPWLIPRSWEKKGCIFFDGTILNLTRGRRFVFCLRYRHGEWDWGYAWLSSSFYFDFYSACLAGK